MAEQIPETANKGLEGVVAFTSEISAIVDVTLSYRGYTIEDLAAHSTFEESAYLLWYNKLPNETEWKEWQKNLLNSLLTSDKNRYEIRNRGMRKSQPDFLIPYSSFLISYSYSL